ncbi:MAG: hypothetical protein AB8G86_02320 [Saprospiraceae bacterium]
MKNLLCLFFITAFFIQSSCQKYTIDNLPDTQIHFGEGGGITGAITEYCLLKNGQLFDKKHFTEDFKSLKKIKKRIAKKSFKKCKKMNIESINLNNPGDKYYFITYQAGKINHKVTWGRNKDEVPAEISALYADLKALTIE